MAYDADLAERIRAALDGEPGVSEKRMFGGLAFLVHDHLAVAASGRGGLMVRVEPDESDALVAERGVARMVMGGREMHGWLRVDDSAVEDEAALHAWVWRGVRYAASLPPK